MQPAPHARVPRAGPFDIRLKGGSQHGKRCMLCHTCAASSATPARADDGIPPVPPRPQVAVLAAAALLAVAMYRLLFPSGRPVYLVDFSVHKVRRAQAARRMRPMAHAPHCVGAAWRRGAAGHRIKRQARLGASCKCFKRHRAIAPRPSGSACSSACGHRAQHRRMQQRSPAPTPAPNTHKHTRPRLHPTRSQGLDEWKFPKAWFVPQSRQVGKGKFTEDDLDFQEKILMRCVPASWQLDCLSMRIS